MREAIWATMVVLLAGCSGQSTDPLEIAYRVDVTLHVGSQTGSGSAIWWAHLDTATSKANSGYDRVVVRGEAIPVHMPDGEEFVVLRRWALGLPQSGYGEWITQCVEGRPRARIEALRSFKGGCDARFDPPAPMVLRVLDGNKPTLERLTAASATDEGVYKISVHVSVVAEGPVSTGVAERYPWVAGLPTATEQKIVSADDYYREDFSTELEPRRSP